MTRVREARRGGGPSRRSNRGSGPGDHLLELAAGGVIERFLDPDEAAGQRPLVLKGCQTAADEQDLQVAAFEAEDDTVNGEGGAEGTEPGIQLLTGSTGTVADNYIACDLATKAAAIVADACVMFENYYTEVATETGGLIGAVSADD